MLKRLKQTLFGEGAEMQDAPGGLDATQLAAAALLMEAALMDGSVDDEEVGQVRTLLSERFGLSEDQVDKLVAAGRRKAQDAVELYTLTKEVKDNFEHDDRVELIEMLWRVAYADGVLHDYEANLIRRVAGLIYVSDQESGLARKDALAALGLDDA